MGRPTKKIYEYDFNGNFLQKYESFAQFRLKYYPNDKGKRPIFVNSVEGYDFHVTAENTIAMTERIYRDNITFLLKLYNSELCIVNDRNNNKPIQMLNLKNEVIAEFSSTSMARLLLKEDFNNLGNMYRQLNKRNNFNNKGLIKDFYFKYKTDTKETE